MAQDVRTIPCDICNTADDVNSFCVNCKQNYCDNCKKGHLRSTLSKKHKFISIGDGLLASKRLEDVCTEHNEQVEFFCRTCRKTTCSVCVTNTHKKHDFCLIAQMAADIRDQLEKVAAGKAEEIENAIQQLNSSTISARYKENSEKNISIIKDTIEDWKKCIEAVEKELIDQEQQQVEDEVKRDELRAKTSEEWNKQCQKLLHDVKAKLRTSSDAALLEHEVEISTKLAAIVVQDSSKSEQSLPSIRLQRPSQDAIRIMLGIERKSSISSLQTEIIEVVQDNSRFFVTEAS